MTPLTPPPGVTMFQNPASTKYRLVQRTRLTAVASNQPTIPELAAVADLDFGLNFGLRT